MMSRHEFGMMQTAPQPGRRYDTYEPWEYSCISVDDNDLEIVIETLNHMDFYWHTIDVKGQGLAYCGITLIPPGCMKAFGDVVQNVPELSELKELSEKALEENKWIIHFGL